MNKLYISLFDSSIKDLINLIVYIYFVITHILFIKMYKIFNKINYGIHIKYNSLHYTFI